MDEWHLKIIVYVLTSQKFAFGEVEKVNFQAVTRHWEHIFFLLTIPKCDLDEVEKRCLKGS